MIFIDAMVQVDLTLLIIAAVGVLQLMKGRRE